MTPIARPTIARAMISWATFACATVTGTAITGPTIAWAAIFRSTVGAIFVRAAVQTKHTENMRRRPRGTMTDVAIART